jgi:CDP-diacylglycerol---glycerol-3-phosphate 3-phosphatidyltransferase
VTVSTTSFGPSALATPANAITMARVLLTPVLLVWIVATGDSWPAVILWIVLSATDGVDGYLARRHGTTRSGAFLDPLADKFLVLGAMVALAAKDRFGWLPVLIIAAREIAMSAYRAWVGRRGVSIPARSLAKVKTVAQDVVVGFALLPLTADNDGLLTVLLWVAVGLTVVSGAQYLLDGSKASASTSP